MLDINTVTFVLSATACGATFKLSGDSFARIEYHGGGPNFDGYRADLTIFTPLAFTNAKFQRNDLVLWDKKIDSLVARIDKIAVALL